MIYQQSCLLKSRLFKENNLWCLLYLIDKSQNNLLHMHGGSVYSSKNTFSRWDLF